MISRLEQAFLRWGWLTPALLPLADFAGRGVFNILFYVYAAWGLLVVARRGFPVDRGYLGLFALVLLAFLCSLPTAVDRADAFHDWFKFFSFSLSGVLVLYGLRHHREGVERLVRAFGLLGVALVLTACVHGLIVSQRADFNPDVHLRDEGLPVLLPFVAFWLWSALPKGVRVWGVVGVAGVMLVYLVASLGRSAVMAWFVAAFFAGVLVFGLPWKRFVAGVAVLLIALVALMPGTLLQGGLEGQDFWEAADKLTSHRSQLWRQALEHPPENQWVGVGVGGSEHFPEVMAIGPARAKMRGLHNMYFDLWYETGWLGTGAFLLFLGYGYAVIARAWSGLRASERMLAGVFLAASFALLSASLLQISYYSRYFAVYMSVCLAGMVHLARASAREREATEGAPLGG